MCISARFLPQYVHVDSRGSHMISLVLLAVSGHCLGTDISQGNDGNVTLEAPRVPLNNGISACLVGHSLLTIETHSGYNIGAWNMEIVVVGGISS